MTIYDGSFQGLRPELGSPERKDIIKNAIIAKLVKIKEWFIAQDSYRFYASSILILYEGLCPHELGSQVSHKREYRYVVKMFYLKLIQRFISLNGLRNCLFDRTHYFVDMVKTNPISKLED